MKESENAEIKHHLECLAKNFTEGKDENHRNSKYRIRKLVELEQNDWKNTVDEIILDIEQKKRSEFIEKTLFSDDDEEIVHVKHEIPTYSEYSTMSKYIIPVVVSMILFYFFV